MVKLKDLYFGDVEGKDEALEAKEKKIFENIFYSGFDWYKDMLDPKKFLIVGRKGTGKTLLAEYFKNEQEKINNAVEILDESNFTLKKMERINYRDLSEQEMILFWEYFFLTEIAKKIVEVSPKWKHKIDFNFRKLISFIENKKYEVVQKKTSSKSSIESALSSTMSPNIKGVIEEVTSNDYEEMLYYKEIKTYHELIAKCKKKTKNNSIFLIFDDLDEVEIFAGTNESKINFIHSMVKTVRRMNQNYREKKVQIKIYLLMRQDMAKDLNTKTSNFNKVIESSSIELNWAYNSKITPMKQPLIIMILRKMKENNISLKSMSDQELFNSFFPKSVSKRPFIKFLLDHSFGRPRDIVMFLNTIKDKYGDNEVIKPHYVSNSVPDYSTKFYRELENEINRNFNKAFIIDGLQLLKDNQVITFNLEHLLETYRKEPSRYPAISSESMIEDCLQELYTLNVIGSTSRVTGTSGKQKNIVEFNYRDNALSNINLNNYISVHYALRDSLNVIAQKKGA